MALREVIKTRGAAGGMKGTYTRPTSCGMRSTSCEVIGVKHVAATERTSSS